MHIYFWLTVYLSILYLCLGWWIVGPLGFYPWCLPPKGTLVSHWGLAPPVEGLMGETSWGRGYWAHLLLILLGACTQCCLIPDTLTYQSFAFLLFFFSSFPHLNAFQKQSVTSPNSNQVIPFFVCPKMHILYSAIFLTFFQFSAVVHNSPSIWDFGVHIYVSSIN